MESSLKAGDASPGGSWISANYKNDFLWLWGVSGKEGKFGHESIFHWLNSGEGKKDLVIVWDGMPEAGSEQVDVSEHLTPIDWALSISRHLLLNSADKLPQFRIFIVDCHLRQYPNAYARRMLNSLLAELTWVSVIRLISLNDSDLSLADRNGPAFLREALKGSSPIALDQVAGDNAKGTIAEVRDTIESFVQGWSANLARSAMYHDVNNVLGPLVLLDTFHRDMPSNNVWKQALLQHARWLDIVPLAAKEERSEAWFDVANRMAELGRVVRVVVVDDQFNSGWNAVIAATLGIPISGAMPPADGSGFKKIAENPGKVELWATTSPTPVLKRLKEELNSSGDARFRLRLVNNDDPAPQPLEILLLDLRLTAGKAENELFEEAHGLAKNLEGKFESGTWPWIPVRPAKIESNSTGRSKQTSTLGKDAGACAHARPTAYLRDLGLLARIVATADLALPIVVFSSSGQRSLTEQFKGFGNIITTFEKPRFMSYRADDIFLEARESFAAAMTSAAIMLKARKAIDLIQQAGSRISADLINQTVLDKWINERSEIVIEVYIDESGNEFIEEDNYSTAIGALFVLGAKHQVDAFKKDVDPLIKKLVDRNRDNFKHILRNSADDLAAKIYASSQIHDIFVSLMSISGNRTQNSMSRARVDSFLEADNFYRELVTALIEFSVYHKAATICEEAARTCYRIFMPTRALSRKEAPKNLESHWGLKETYVGKSAAMWTAIKEAKWKFKNDEEILQAFRSLESIAKQRGREPDRLFRLIQPEDARPIVQLISRQYRLAEFAPEADGAKAYPINSRSNDVSPLHYLADALLSRGITGENVESLRARGFTATYDENTSVVLLAARLIANGHTGDGFAIAANFVNKEGLKGMSDEFASYFGRRLSQFVPRLSGMEFLRMLRAMS